MEKQTISMPMVALRGMTILPEMVAHFDVSRKRSVQAVQKAMQGKEQKVLPEIMFCSITSKKTAPLVRYCH